MDQIFRVKISVDAIESKNSLDWIMKIDDDDQQSFVEMSIKPHRRVEWKENHIEENHALEYMFINVSKIFSASEMT